MNTKSSFWSKLGLLFLFYWGIMLWEGCGKFSNDPCEGQSCPKVEFPFFDYKNITVEESGFFISSNEMLSLTIFPSEVNFIGCSTPRLKFGLLTSAYACECLQNGYEGDKYPITGLKVFSDISFKDGFQPEDPLNELFSVVTIDATGTKTSPLNEVDNVNSVKMFTMIKLQSSARPDDTNQAYRFTIELTKSNGEVISIETQRIRWS